MTASRMCMASSSSLVILSIRDVGIMFCGKLNVEFLISRQWDNVHTKFHENPSSNSRITTFVQSNATRNVVHQGRLRYHIRWEMASS
jgi:hypothetical protein